MKRKGATTEFAQERSDDLMRAYDEYIQSCEYIRLPELFRAIVNMPASRFWVSEMRAAVIVSAIRRGTVDLNDMLPLKKEMYLEIYHRVMRLRRQYPEKTLYELCAIVVNQPAPKFYLTPGSARVMVWKARKEWLKKKWERLRRLA